MASYRPSAQIRAYYLRGAVPRSVWALGVCRPPFPQVKKQGCVATHIYRTQNGPVHHHSEPDHTTLSIIVLVPNLVVNEVKVHNLLDFSCQMILSTSLTGNNRKFESGLRNRSAQHLYISFTRFLHLKRFNKKACRPVPNGTLSTD